MHVIFCSEPILCSLDALNIDEGTFTVDGAAVTESQPVNTVITYQCNPGLVLIGSAERTCEIVENSANGEWSGSVPSCEMPNIMPLPTISEQLSCTTLLIVESVTEAVIPHVTASLSADLMQGPNGTGRVTFVRLLPLT